MIYDALEDDEHPLLQAAEFEIDDLKTGKWEWLFAWLSPCHMMAEYPTVMIEIAQFLTGRKPIPAQIRKELKQRLLGQ